MTSILPVVLAGGSGTRLWPLSRALHPKQFLALTSGRSMMQETLLRIVGLPAEPPCVVCNEEHRFLVAEQCREIDLEWSAILLECAPRNTAPAIALAACHALAKGSDPVLLVVPSDGHFERDEVFRDAVLAGLESAASGKLVTFGIRPASPHTGYGYIRPAKTAGPVRQVSAFVEKPGPADATAYAESGEFLWNAGVFLLRASVYLEELARHAPGVVQPCRTAVDNGVADLDFFRPGPAFADAPNISVDRAVMEKTDAAVVVPMDTGWSDVGSWEAVHALGKTGADNNVLRGDVMAVRTSNSVVHAADRFVATLGIDGLIVAETADAVLVADRSEAQQVQDIVMGIERCARLEHHTHRHVHRPWGHFETLEVGREYQVKRIVVKPGAKLSLQIHRDRSEHWVVVHGTAEVTRDDATHTLTENQSTYISKGTRHRLHNPGTVPLEVIEVQVGTYLGEDDIVRLDDDFGRGAPDGGSQEA